MLSSQADEYTVTPDRRFSSSGEVRSGFRDFVRDIKRKSLRRKKLCIGNHNFETLCPQTTNNKLEQNENCETINSQISQGRD